MVGEQVAALIGLFMGVLIGASVSITAARRGNSALVPALLTALSAAMAVASLVEGDSTMFFMGAMLTLFSIYPLIWRAGSTALRIAYSALLIAIPILFITIAGTGVISRLTGVLALVGIAGGIANIVMLAKR